MKILRMLLKQLKEPTEICKVCFDEHRLISFRNIVHKDDLCEKCFKIRDAKFYRFNIDDVPALAIYDYDETMKSLIYQFKGCYDIELANSFLSNYRFELKLMYFHYHIIYIPSSFDDDKRRGFNHVKEIFKILKLPCIDVLYKTKNYKQSEQSMHNRHLIKNYLSLKNNQDLQGKSILLVDDIFTSGSTLKAAIDLIKTLHPKRIKVLVLCKVKH